MASASTRRRDRKDGTVGWSVVYRIGKRQSSLAFATQEKADAFVAVIKAVGIERALETYGVSKGPRRMTEAVKEAQAITVVDWLNHYIDHLIVDKGTLDRYRGYVRNDISPVFGSTLLITLSREDVSKWVQWLQEFGAINRKTKKRGPASAKTIANKHGFLSAALAAAVPKHIPANPASAQRLPQGDAKEIDDEIMFLSREQFATLHAAVPEYWRPLVEFLVASGCRWGEATGLRPSDIDRTKSTVRIRRAWTYSKGGYRLVKPKGKSLRTINVPKATLDKLDYSKEWVFTSRAGGPVRSHGFHDRVWGPALQRSKLDPAPRIHDLRHTCASWMVAAGVSLPVVQQHLGHQSITTTIGTYTHIDRQSLAAAADAVADMLKAEESPDR